jgi:hypothetical protein
VNSVPGLVDIHVPGWLACIIGVQEIRDRIRIGKEALELSIGYRHEVADHRYW